MIRWLYQLVISSFLIRNLTFHHVALFFPFIVILVKHLVIPSLVVHMFYRFVLANVLIAAMKTVYSDFFQIISQVSLIHSILKCKQPFQGSHHMHWTAVEDLSLLATFQSGFPFFHPHISADAKGGRGANEIIQAVFFYTAVVRNDNAALNLAIPTSSS